MSDSESKASAVRAQPGRLYGRRIGHPLRPRQQRLMEEELPRFSFDKPEDVTAYLSNHPEITSVFLEIGFGGGEHAFAQAQLNPNTLYLACETFENGICSLLNSLCPQDETEKTNIPKHLKIWPHDARVLMDGLPDHILDRAYLMFPDPWPKARHAKRRFVHPDNFKRLDRLLKKDALWRIASDHPAYQEWVNEIMPTQDVFEFTPHTTERPEGWSPTRYESKAIRENRVPFYWSLKRKQH